MPHSFRPGERAPCTALYKAVHANHAAPHEVAVLFDEIFPPCLTCGDAVEFELVTLSVHVYAHPMFVRDF